jgi:hypothetical protein
MLNRKMVKYSPSLLRFQENRRLCIHARVTLSNDDDIQNNHRKITPGMLK